jgi:hypothetical protein
VFLMVVACATSECTSSMTDSSAVKCGFKEVSTLVVPASLEDTASTLSVLRMSLELALSLGNSCSAQVTWGASVWAFD